MLCIEMIPMGLRGHILPPRWVHSTHLSLLPQGASALVVLLLINLLFACFAANARLLEKAS